MGGVFTPRAKGGGGAGGFPQEILKICMPGMHSAKF